VAPVTFPFLQKHPRKRTPHYGTRHEGSAWDGPVERRDPRHYQRQTDVGIRMCRNEWCRLWIASHAARCPHCHERQTSA
jgi:hypothetical protein